MARIHPGNLDQLRVEAPHRAELHTLDQLAAHLPDDYQVYHSLHFAHLERGRQRFGEVDFVVVNGSGDILLLEQKNGGLIESGGGLHKDYADGRKDVVSQVQHGRDAVMQQLATLLGREATPAVSVLLYCPDHELQGAGTSGLPREAILDATERNGLEAWIEHHLGPGGRDDKAQVAREVRAWAARELRLAPDLAASIDRQQRTYARMAGGLVELVDGLDLSPWRLKVQASAGSGKTLAAQHAFRKARAEGRRPLLLCFNSVLANNLQASLDEHRDVGTFHNWCRRMIEESDRVFDQKAAGTPEYWHRIVQEVVDCEPPEPRYDTFIIDEAQDFDPEWWALLECFGADDPDARILCFEDAQQNLYDRPGVPMEDCVRFRSPAVYRTPRQLGRFIDRVLGPDVEWRSPYEGLPVRVHPWQDETEQLDLLAARVEALLETGFAPEQILILSMKGRSHACFGGLVTVGAHRLRRFTGNFSGTGAPMFTAGQLEAETLLRFKGNQRPAVIVTDFDLDGSAPEREWRKAYCALTRATVACEVLVAQSSAWRERLTTAQ